MEFENLWMKYAGEIYSFAMSVVRNKSIAEDICQSTVMQAYRSFHQLKDREKFKNWLYAIAKNEIYGHYRKNKSTIAMDFEQLNSVMEASAVTFRPDEAIVNNIVISDFLRMFDVQWQKAFLMYYYYGFKKTEISRITGISTRKLLYWLRKMGMEAWNLLNHREANWQNVKSILKND